MRVTFMHGSIAAFSFHARRHSGGDPVSGDHPVSVRLRSERHGRTTVAGPTRKLWLQDRRWLEPCQGGPGKRTAFRQKRALFFCWGQGEAERDVSACVRTSGEAGGVFRVRQKKFFFSKAAGSEGGGTRAFCGSAGERTGAERSFQNVYKAEPFTLYRTHEKVGKT